MENKRRPPRLLGVIVNRDKGDVVSGLLAQNSVELSFSCVGFGTAASELLSLLGLGSRDKTVILSLIPDSLIPKAMRAISRRMAIRNPGQGIAFTLPLNGLNALAASYLDSKDTDQHRRREDDTVKFILIISVFTSGFSDVVMAAATSSGATGGTILHAKGAGGQNAEGFLGISLSEEKDILAILAPEEDGRAIMEAINSQCGPRSQAGAIVFSLPVKDMIGL